MPKNAYRYILFSGSYTVALYTLCQLAIFKNYSAKNNSCARITSINYLKSLPL